ncbi:MAG: NAD(P)H-hydrate epimerase, partial [Porticoccaceae bacterium]
MSVSAAALYTAAQTRELDRRAIEEHGIPGIALMKHAGASAFRELCRRWPEARSITVFCGSGNNGGDGYVIAALARERGLASRVIHLTEPALLKGDAALAWRFAAQAGVPMESFSADSALTADVLVDALLGTGIARPVTGAHAAAIAAINGAGIPVLAVDIPSGLHADTGAELGIAVRAQVTVTFIGRKLGLHTGRGPALTGAIRFDRLDVPDAVYRDDPAAELLN